MSLPSTLCALLLTALTLPVVTAELTILPSNNSSLLWGPYRPNLYLGIRPRVPDSLVAGLMWGKLDEMEKKLRHSVDISAGMARYGWTAYNAREGGSQTIEDVGNKIDVTTEFVKKYDGGNAGNWALRIRGVPRTDARADLKTTVVFYVGMENMRACHNCVLEAHEQYGREGDNSVQAVNVAFAHPILGAAGIHIPAPIDANNRYEGTVVKSLNVTENMLWQANSTFFDTLKGQNPKWKKGDPLPLVLPNEPGAGNMHLVQMICHGQFEFDVLYSSHAASHSMTSSQVNTDIESTVQAYKQDRENVFRTKPPFNTEDYSTFSNYVLANLLGGLGSFHGVSKVDTSKKAIYAETTAKFWEKSDAARKHATPETKGPFSLLTHTPSRATFPRGFLWDEGFHLLPVLEWDADLAVEIVRNWFALMDEDGWIGREQILGAEAESRTPGDFVTQYPHIANPPTMFLVISNFVDILEGKTKYNGRESSYVSSEEVGRSFITELYPLLKKHYNWFRASQSGDVEVHSVPSANLNEGYRWRGRTPETNYPSGLDDFPRAEPPDITELHLDALCWVGVMARVLEKVAFFTQATHEAFIYQNHIRGVNTNLNALHWDAKQNLYCDTFVREDVHSYVCHKGYVSLFPLLTGFMSAIDPHLPAVLDLLSNPNHLWTNHGIRSLSPESKKYGVGENYWRSPIWVNINFLIIEQLLILAKSPGPEQQRCRGLYVELRRNMVETVYKSWRETGYVWEQYDPVGGHGQRTQHFTGWSALVVKIMAMPDLENEGVREKMREYYEEAKKQAVASQGFSSGGLVFAVLLMAFLYFTRRRFAATLRSWRANIKARRN